MGSVPIDCSCRNPRQPEYHNRGADGDSAATGTKSPSRRTWVWKLSSTLACPSRDVTETLTLALENYYGFPLSHRQKRGFFDGIGHLSRMFFGTVMNEDVEEPRDKYNHLALIASVHNKAKRFNSKHIARLEQHVHDIASYT